LDTGFLIPKKPTVGDMYGLGVYLASNVRDFVDALLLSPSALNHLDWLEWWWSQPVKDVTPMYL
jgi:hypothetical protein